MQLLKIYMSYMNAYPQKINIFNYGIIVTPHSLVRRQQQRIHDVDRVHNEQASQQAIEDAL